MCMDDVHSLMFVFVWVCVCTCVQNARHISVDVCVVYHSPPKLYTHAQHSRSSSHSHTHTHTHTHYIILIPLPHPLTRAHLNIHTDFGEIMCWIGIFLTSTSVYPSNTHSAYVSILSPLFTILLLMFVSGIPLGEERYDQKYGAVKEYREWKRVTSPLIPMPQCVYGRLPMVVKK